MKTDYYLKITILYLIILTQGLAETYFVYEGTIVSDQWDDGHFFSAGDTVYVSYAFDYSVSDIYPSDQNYGYYPDASASLKFHHAKSGFEAHFTGGDAFIVLNQNPDGTGYQADDGMALDADTAVETSYLGDNAVEYLMFDGVGDGSMFSNDSLPDDFVDLTESILTLTFDDSSYINLYLVLKPYMQGPFDIE
ncbi:MAG: hypothetical protein AAGB06_05805 [Verrucomicrobiota bacterium]